MAATAILLHDQTPTGHRTRSIQLTLASERVTAREILRRRIEEEVAEYNRTAPEIYGGLVQPSGAERELNGFDGQNAPSKSIEGTDLWVELSVNTPEHGEAATSEAGIYLHVQSDHVRFHRRAGAPVPLAEIPPLVFSEAMRDIDLFVALASVGNDPNWVDRGDAWLRDYWRGFAFGELSATARTRREVLERLLPRLKIADRCTLVDRFLVVRGDLRTYKIHLGSANILMDPNDQYLCIVPGRSSGSKGSAVKLPFEGDSTLSLILSKAILLAADKTIVDPSIVSQIARST